MLDRLMPLHKAIFTEPGVAGVKYCLGKMGLINNVVRSPLTTVEPGTAALLDKAMAHCGREGLIWLPRKKTSRSTARL